MLHSHLLQIEAFSPTKHLEADESQMRLLPGVGLNCKQLLEERRLSCKFLGGLCPCNTKFMSVHPFRGRFFRDVAT